MNILPLLFQNRSKGADAGFSTRETSYPAAVHVQGASGDAYPRRGSFEPVRGHPVEELLRLAPAHDLW